MLNPFIAGIVFTASVLAPGIVLGQQCASTEDMQSQLTEAFHEEPVWVGLNAKGNLSAVWVSETGSWTFTVSTPDGRTCMMDSGQGWDLDVPEVGVES